MRTFLKVIHSLATGEAGVERIFHQFVAGSRNQFSVPKDGYKYISWDFILGSLMSLCDALIKSSGTSRHSVSPDEFEGFAAYMRLLGKLFQEGAPALVANRISQVDVEFRAILRNEKLMHIILFIFCKPVPPELKVCILTHPMSDDLFGRLDAVRPSQDWLDVQALPRFC